jgi:DNA-binding response OmpR family regulator/HPt (histidine-containing phosphotransfer) domain-containing protein
MRILLVEDDESVAQVLEKVLTDEHYVVDVAPDGDAGWQLVSASHYDLVVLDIILPKSDGLEFCQRLRECAYNMPVLLVTALDSSSKKIAGLNAGADDYVTKPFELEELLARVKALLRRSKTSVLLTLEWGPLRLVPSSREVFYQETRLNLTPKEHGLLELFLRNPAHVFSRSAILDSLWSYSEAPGEETVTSHIKGLRRKLSEAGAPADLIVTVYGVGYRLKASDAQDEPETASLAAGSLAASATASAHMDTSNAELQAAEMRQQKITAALSTLWHSVKAQQLERLKLLRQALQKLQCNQLTDEIRQSAHRAAHSLTGALGIFGLKAGSDLARSVESLLQGNLPISSADQMQLQELIDALGETLAQAVKTPQQRSDQIVLPLLILIDTQLELVPSLVSAIWAQGFTVKIAPDLAALQKLLTALSGSRSEQLSSQLAVKGALPDVVLLNFSFETSDDQQLAQLSTLIRQVSSLMVLICSASGSLESRVQASHLGNYPFLEHPYVSDIVKGIDLLRSPPSTQKVLVVDDDPQILAALKIRLEAQGFQTVTLGQPLGFWQVLQECAPDLLLLDIEMPKYTGIELCQAVRQSPHWSQLPIVFFTSHADAPTQQAAFRAGANDIVEKSSSPADLLAQVSQQLQRAQLNRAIAAIASGDQVPEGVP